MKLDRLPWIDIHPYDQILNGLVNSCQNRETSLVCVKGPIGSGKSRMSSELLAKLAFAKKSGLIELDGRSNAALIHNVEITANLLTLDNEDFFANFLLTLEKAFKYKQHFYILVNDADVIDPALIFGMINIIKNDRAVERRITLVLFMGMTPIHVEIQNLLRDAKTIILQSMTGFQSKQFANHIYKNYLQKDEITDAEAEQLYSASYGYPGKLIAILEYMQQEEKAQIELIEQKPKNFSLLKKIPLAILVIVIGFIIVQLLNRGQENSIVNENPFIPTVMHVDEELPIVIKKEIISVKIIYPIQRSKVDKEQPIVIKKEVIPVEKEPFVQNDDIKTTKQGSSFLKDSIIIEQQDLEKEIPIYAIELGRNQSKSELQSILKDRSIPGTARFKQIENGDSKLWIAYIGPYGSERQAIQGKKKLPASLQSLHLKVNKEF